MAQTGASFGGLNLSQMAKYFSDETAARLLLEGMRWPHGPVCPLCDKTETVYRMQSRPASKKPGRPGLLRCRACKKQFTVTTGTVFEDSHIPLSKWLLAIHLLCSSKKGMSAHQLGRMLGLVSYRSAWFMAHRLRYAMQEGPLAGLLSGVVEADETYIGAKKKRGGKRGRPGPDSHKTPVVALIERGGKMRAMSMRIVDRLKGDDDPGLLPPLPVTFEQAVKGLLGTAPPPNTVKGSRAGKETAKRKRAVKRTTRKKAR